MDEDTRHNTDLEVRVGSLWGWKLDIEWAEWVLRRSAEHETGWFKLVSVTCPDEDSRLLVVVEHSEDDQIIGGYVADILEQAAERQPSVHAIQVELALEFSHETQITIKATVMGHATARHLQEWVQSLLEDTDIPTWIEGIEVVE